MVNIDKLLRKRKPTGAELGVLEIANFAHIWQQKVEGVEVPQPLYDRDSFQKKIDKLTGMDSIVYNAYLEVHDWLSRRNATAYMHSLTAQTVALWRLQSIMRTSAHEAVYSYIYDSPVIMTPQQFKREKENGFKGNARAIRRGVAVLQIAKPDMIDDDTGDYIPPKIMSQGVTDVEAIAMNVEGSFEIRDRVDDMEWRIYSSYRFVYGFNETVDMIADFLDLPSIKALKVSMKDSNELLEEFNTRVSLEKELLSLTIYDDDELRLRKLDALEGFFSDQTIKPEELSIREEDRAKAWELITHLQGFHDLTLIELMCYDHDDGEEAAE